MARLVWYLVSQTQDERENSVAMQGKELNSSEQCLILVMKMYTKKYFHICTFVGSEKVQQHNMTTILKLQYKKQFIENI